MTQKLKAFYNKFTTLIKPLSVVEFVLIAAVLSVIVVRLISYYHSRAATQESLQKYER